MAIIQHRGLGRVARSYRVRNSELVCLYVCSSYPPDGSAVATRSAALVRALQQSFLQVMVLSAGPGRCIEGVNVFGVGLGTPSNRLPLSMRLMHEWGFAILASLRLFWIARTTPLNVVVLSSPPFWLALACAWMARTLHVPYAVDVRDRYPDVFLAMGLLRSDGWLLRLLLAAESQLYRHAVLTTSVTHAIVAAISREHGHDVELVRNGFDPDLFQPDIDLKPPIADGQPLRLIMHGMFGRFFDQNVFSALVRGAEQRQLPMKFLVVGHGPQMSAIEGLVSPLLEICAPMPQSELAKFLRSSHLGVALGIDNASMRGTFPTKLFESIGCGLPVMVFPRSEAGLELATRGMGWTFAADQVEDALTLLQRMCLNPLLWQRSRLQVLKYRRNYIRTDQSLRYSELLRDSLD